MMTVLALNLVFGTAWAQDEAGEPGGVDKLDSPAVVEITDTVIRRDIRPIGVNPDSFGGWGMLDYTANQFIKGGGFEPVSVRWKGCVVAGGKGWFEADYMPPFWSGALVKKGALDGMRVRAYRMVKADGSPLDVVEAPGWWQYPKYVNTDEADHAMRLADTTIATASDKLPRGGYVNNRCNEDGPRLYGMTYIPYNTSWTGRAVGRAGRRDLVLQGGRHKQERHGHAA